MDISIVNRREELGELEEPGGNAGVEESLHLGTSLTENEEKKQMFFFPKIFRETKNLVHTFFLYNKNNSLFRSRS